MPSWQATAKLVRTIANNYRLPYFTLSPTYSICPEHGYIVGEQYTCPHCGKETEVYSRITGYYRPLKNWNAGKTQEFKERREYDALNSMNVHTEKSDKVIRDEECTVKSEYKNPNNEILLFATKTCPKCKMAEMMLDKANISYRIIDAEENVELTRKYNVTEAPTMIVPKGDSLLTIENPSNIKKFIEDNK